MDAVSDGPLKGPRAKSVLFSDGGLFECVRPNSGTLRFRRVAERAAGKAQQKAFNDPSQVVGELPVVAHGTPWPSQLSLAEASSQVLVHDF